MLPVVTVGEAGPLLVMLHWLGGGAQTWDEVSHGLAARGVRCAALDLPGFGEAAGMAGYDIASMADQVIETVQFLRRSAVAQGGADEPQPWFLAGHSMGGTVAAVVARKAADGTPGLEGLRGLVLVSPSPPGPEPMGESKREQALHTLGEVQTEPARKAQQAARFVDENTGKLPLREPVRARAIAGVLAMNRTAFHQWMAQGSKEDWRERVGELDLPAIVFGGTEDEALGPDAQRKRTVPHLPLGKLITLQGAGHLAPLERPGELVEYLTQFFADAGAALRTPVPRPGKSFEALLRSERVSPQTRAVMQDRLASAQNWNATPTVFAAHEVRTLRALVNRVVPGVVFDLAASLEAQVKGGQTDGWRFAMLPSDAEAWQRGLFSLDQAALRAHSVLFVALHPEQQDSLLEQAAAGKLGPGLLGNLHLGEAVRSFSAVEMQFWFEDVRADCARLYMADPRTMDRVGFAGFADDLGFTQIQLGAGERLRN